MKSRVSKIIRIITLPPVLALVLVTLLRNQYPQYHALAAAFFLAVLPASSYLVWRVVPKLYKKGRSSQRWIAVIFSVVGYIGGLLTSILLDGSPTEKLVYLCYVFSGTMIALTSRMGIRSSGHAAGVAGPVAALSICISPWFLLGAVLLIPVYKSSLELKRHSVKELLLGSAYPVLAAVFLSFVLFR